MILKDFDLSSYVTLSEKLILLHRKEFTRNLESKIDVYSSKAWFITECFEAFLKNVYRQESLIQVRIGIHIMKTLQMSAQKKEDLSLT